MDNKREYRLLNDILFYTILKIKIFSLLKIPNTNSLRYIAIRQTMLWFY